MKIRQSALRFANFLCKFRGKRPIDSMEKFLDNFHRRLNNVNFSMETNGEYRVLKIISGFAPSTIFDVGANKGEWSLLAHSLNPNSIIHAFEIVPEVFDSLNANIQNCELFKLNNFGLSYQEELIKIHLGVNTVASTAYKINGMKFHDNYYDRSIKCEVVRADSYIKKENIQKVDFVKIDVEGMDLKVIKGFGKTLDRVGVIQFEYGIFNISSHDLLADFCRFLTSNEFVVGKIFPRYVHFFDYHFDMENFHGSNFIAVKKDKIELIEKLKQYG